MNDAANTPAAGDAKELTLVFFLWRRRGTTPASFEHFYNHNHQELVAGTVSPPPRLFERHFVMHQPPGRTSSSSLDTLSFDSFTAATFASGDDFGQWGAILSDPATAKMLDENEAEFTEPERRIQLFADPVRSGADRPVADAQTVLLRLSEAAPRIDRSEFRAAHEAFTTQIGPLPGELRRVRYYLQPNHPLSYARAAWDQDAKATYAVVEHLGFQDGDSARRGIAALRQAMGQAEHLGRDHVIRVRQETQPPTAWRPQNPGTP